jgi:hypothetical protein
MAGAATHNFRTDLARLDEAAEHAGCALACAHQSAEELHSDLVRRYFAMHPRRRPFGLALTASAAAIVILLLI